MGHKHRKKSKHRHKRKNSKQKPNTQSPNKQRSNSRSVGKLPAEPVKEPVVVKDEIDATPTCVLAPEDYCNIFSISKKINNQGLLVKPVEKQKTKEKVQSDADVPTVMIAPADYKNYFSNQNPVGKAKQSVNIQPPKEPSANRVPSDTPTNLIAPDDYQCLFSKNKPKQYPIQIGNVVTLNNNASVKQSINPAPKVQSQRPPPVERVPSDTPTALIAPADYVCIYKNPQNQQKDDGSRPNEEN